MLYENVCRSPCGIYPIRYVSVYKNILPVISFANNNIVRAEYLIYVLIC